MPRDGDVLTDPARRCDRRPARSFGKVRYRRNGVAITPPVPTPNWERLAVITVAAARYGRDPLLAKTRDAIGMQLRIIDRPAFLLHTIGTEAAVRVHDRLITLAVAHVLLRRPRAWPIARIGLRAICYYLGPARVHLRLSGCHS